MLFHFNSNIFFHITLGATSLAASKLFFWLLNDPEGANLPIVLALGVSLYSIAFFVARFLPFPNPKRLLAAIALQIVIVGMLFLVLH